jgi:hypothetical protein
MQYPNCPCGAEIITTVERHPQYFTQHCSHYCWIYYQNPKAYPDVRLSESKHHKNIWMRPKIPISCDWCGDEFTITHNKRNNNKQFCGRDCSLKMKRGKNSCRDWRILKMLQYHPQSTAKQLGQYWIDHSTICSSRTIGAVLRVYVARGIVAVTKLMASNTYQYSLSPQFLESGIPLAYAVQNKSKFSEA